MGIPHRGTMCPVNPENVHIYARGQDILSREQVLEAEKAALQATLEAERAECAKPQQGTIKMVFDSSLASFS